jgi:hypothetical protein
MKFCETSALKNAIDFFLGSPSSEFSGKLGQFKIIPKNA